MRQRTSGFTLIELLMVVTVIGILATIAITKYESMIRKSNESATRGNLAAIRSALSVYYGDNPGEYPYDNLTSLTLAGKYLPAFPTADTPPFHFKSSLVTAEATPTDTGGWSYNSDSLDVEWGKVRVGCTHQDSRGLYWTHY